MSRSDVPRVVPTKPSPARPSRAQAAGGTGVGAASIREHRHTFPHPKFNHQDGCEMAQQVAAAAAAAASPRRKKSGPSLSNPASKANFEEKQPNIDDEELELYLNDVKKIVSRVGERLNDVDDIDLSLQDDQKSVFSGETENLSDAGSVASSIEHTTEEERAARYLDAQAYRLRGASSYMYYAPRLNSDRILKEMKTAYSGVSTLTHMISNTIK